MSRETATTTTIAYETEPCHVCETEVALADDIPADEPVAPGYAVIVGEGTLTAETESAGNWDVELTFAGEQTEKSAPNVTAYHLCHDCAEAIHGETPDQPFTGSIPSELMGSSTQDLSESQAIMVAITGITVLLFLLVLLI